MKKLLAVLLALGILFSAGSAFAAQQGGEITIGMGSDATSLDPRFVTTTSGMYITSQIFNGLVELNKDLEYEPVLAEEVETPTDTRYVFHLKEGVKFHDGSELTAEDVKFTYQSMLDPDVGSPKSGNYTQIVGAEEFLEGEADEVEGIEIVDEYTVAFELKEPFAPFLVNMNVGIVPKEIAEGNEDFEEDPVGTGPFVFESRETDQETVIKANDDYFEGRPNLDKVTYRVIPENSARLVELEKGEIDVLMSVEKSDRDLIRKNPDLNLASIAGTNYNYVGFNVNNEPVDDKYLRKAIAYALDKDAITNHFNGSRTFMPLPASSPLGDEIIDMADINKYEHDVSKAKEMLQKSDYDGEEVVIKVSDDWRKELAQIMQQMMNSVGINTKVEVYEWGTFYEDVKEGEAQIYLLGWYGIIDPDGYWFFHSEMTPPEGGSNRMFYSNEEADELIEEGRATINEEERKEVYADLFEIITDDAPMIFLFSEMDESAYWDNIKGFEAAPYPVTILDKLPEVYIEE